MKTVDIDTADPSDARNSTFANSIEAHSLIAEFYKHRPPYLNGFFKAAVEKLGILRNSIVLDLCCGRGELASHLSEFCELILAVDGSDRMLENSIYRENVTYIQCDINNDDLVLPTSIDHLVIGSSIHWISQNSLQIIIKSNLNEGGKILVSHSLFRTEDQDYHKSLVEINAKYGRRVGPVDLLGRQKLQTCGYEKSDGIRVVRHVTFDIEYLFRNQLSYLYRDFYKNVSKDIQGYRRDFYDALTPFLSDHKLSGALVNWGIIYSPMD